MALGAPVLIPADLLADLQPNDLARYLEVDLDEALTRLLVEKGY